MTRPAEPDYARNMRVVGHSDQGGRPDGVQVMVHRGFAYVGHMFSKGFSVIDVRDAENPCAVNYVAAPPNTWTIHLQTHDDLLLVINAKDMFAAAEFADERAYYSGALGKTVGTSRKPARVRDWSAGLAVYDISTPDNPRRIGFMPVEGGGIHRIWYTGGRWAYVSVLLDGFTDYIFMTVDMSDPAEAARGRALVDPGHEPGGRRDAVMAADPPLRPAPRHHPRRHRLCRLARCRHGGARHRRPRQPEADRAPKLVAAALGGGTHNCLPLPDRDLLVRARRGRARSPGRWAQTDLGVRQSRARKSGQHFDRFRRRPKPTTRPKAGISARTISTKTGPEVSSARN